MRYLCCGDRNWINKDRIREVLLSYLNAPNPITEIIEGEARGADRLAAEVAEELGLKVLRFPARWYEYGRAAGPIRNRQMLIEGKPDAVFAFHENIFESKGTLNMVRQSHKAGLLVWVFTSSNEQEWSKLAPQGY